MNYKKNYIDEFIFRIDFKEVDSETTKELVKRFEEEFKEIFDGIKSRNVFDNVISINQDKEPEIIDKKVNVEYRIYNDNEFITITNKYICYENRKYKYFEDAKTIIYKIIDTIKKYSKIENCTRLGMRYINDIILPAETEKELFNWNGYINSALLNKTKFFLKNNKKILQSMDVIDIESNIDNNIYYTLQYGIYNSRKPGKLLDKEYIIDIDGRTKTVEELDEIKTKIDSIHSEIEEIFEIIIEEKLRENMEKIDEK